MPQCVGLSCRFSGRAGRLEEVRVFSGTAGTCRVRVRDPGALRGRLGAGVVAYVPRYGAYVTLSRAPRETALFPVHCSHSSLPGRYASAAYTPVCGGTTGNMPRIPGGGFLECCDMLRAGLVALRRFGVSVWFAMVRHASLRGDTPYWLTMARYDTPGVRRYASVYVGSGSPVWLVMVRFAGGRGCVASRHLLLPVEEPGLIWRVFSRGSRSGNTGPSHNVALCRAMARAGGSLGCSAMFRLTGSRGPGRLSSGTAAGSAALPSHCFASGGIFFREPGRLPGAGARIRAGKGSVQAQSVPGMFCPSCIVPFIS